MWLRNFIKERAMRSQLKNWEKRKAGAVTIDPLQFPAYYLKHFTDEEAIDRRKVIESSISDVWDIILWAESIAFDLNTDAMSNRIPTPGSKGVLKSMRVDKFLYCPQDSKYVSLTDVMRRLRDSYETIALVAKDKERVSHYRARDRVVPAVGDIHKVLLSLLK